MYNTYVGKDFNSLPISAQETLLIHEMGHPYTGYGQLLHNTGMYDVSGDIPAKCGTAASQPQ